MSILLNMTDPTKSVASILLAFFLLYVLSASLLYIAVDITIRAIGLHSKIPDAKYQLNHQRSKYYYIASVIAFAPVCFLALGSIGKIQLFDVVLITILVVLMVFYVLKKTP